MSKRSKHVKAMWRSESSTLSLRQWARLNAWERPSVAAWLLGKCKACHAHATR